MLQTFFCLVITYYVNYFVASSSLILCHCCYLLRFMYLPATGVPPTSVPPQQTLPPGSSTSTAPPGASSLSPGTTKFSYIALGLLRCISASLVNICVIVTSLNITRVIWRRRCDTIPYDTIRYAGI